MALTAGRSLFALGGGAAGAPIRQRSISVNVRLSREPTIDPKQEEAENIGRGSGLMPPSRCKMFVGFDNPFAVFAIALVSQAMAAIFGDFLRKRTHSFKQGERHDFNTVQAAILTLLALLIGFSFSMAVTGYDQRKTLEEAEPNVIATAYLRAGLLPVGQWLTYSRIVKKISRFAHCLLRRR